MESVKSFMSKNQALSVAIILSMAILTTFLGCEPKVPSLTSKDEKVSYSELEIEYTTMRNSLLSDIQTLDKQYTNKIADLVDQYERMNTLLTMGQSIIEPMLGPYAPVGTTVFGILAVGLGIDNRRKDGVIAAYKKMNENSDNIT